jgi:hypothetical protein
MFSFVQYFFIDGKRAKKSTYGLQKKHMAVVFLRKVSKMHNIAPCGSRVDKAIGAVVFHREIR